MADGNANKGKGDKPRSSWWEEVWPKSYRRKYYTHDGYLLTEEGLVREFPDGTTVPKGHPMDPGPRDHFIPKEGRLLSRLSPFEEMDVPARIRHLRGSLEKTKELPMTAAKTEEIDNRLRELDEMEARVVAAQNARIAPDSLATEEKPQPPV